MNKGMSLLELQRLFYKTVFDSQSPENGEFYARIKTTVNLSGEQSVNIYKDSILGGLTDALFSIYPVCVKLVGEMFFKHMVADYLRRYPSNSPDLGDYGSEFSVYITDFEPVRELEYLADLVTLEWSWHRAFNAPDTLAAGICSIADLSTVAEVDQGSIHFVTTPSAILVRSIFPIHQIWQVNQEDYVGNGIVNLDDGAVCLVVWRNAAFGMRIDVLSEQEYEFLQAVTDGKSFSEIATLPCASDLSGILGRCMQTGLIAGFTLVK
ncbi:hypothetical protein A9Q81_16270 [Gammaproteobacteria bacterium 42_54_T18]|nr:hypothetical protein A9Q81_16270 [Gammaproteobacteria bacterium 42_54_T18]